MNFSNEALKHKKRLRSPKPRLADKATEAIRSLIIRNEFKPNELLSEVQLAEMLGISRTPVREAINQLENEGLVKIVPGLGAFVGEMKVEDIKEINDLRFVLEPLAVESALDNIPVEEMEKQMQVWGHFLSQLEEGRFIGSEQLSEADQSLHDLIVDHCKNSRLQNFLKNLRYQIQLYVFDSWESKEFMEETIRQHLEILRYMIIKDLPALQTALQAHIEHNNRYHLRRIR